MFLRASPMRQHAKAAAGSHRTLFLPAHCSRATGLPKRSLLAATKSTSALRAFMRNISVQSSKSPSLARGIDIPRHSQATPLLDLAADISAALDAVQSTSALGCWADRIDLLASKCNAAQTERRVGVMYVSGMEAQSALVAASLFTRHLSGSADLAKQLAETTAAVLCESSAPASVALGSEIVVSASGKAVRQLAAGADTVKAEDLGTSASIHVDFLAVPEANAMDINAFADWLFDCDCVVIVADRAGIAQTLTGTKSFLQCLQLHPSTLHVLTGLGTSHATVSSFSGLLREVLGSLGLPISSAIDSAYWLTPAEALLSQDMEAAQPDLLHGDLTARLASAIRAAILCAEHGGSTAVVQAGRGLSAPQIGSTTAFSTAGLSKALLACLDSAARSDIKSLSPVSKHIQHGFEGTDLLTVDASIGATKSRVRAWFAGGTVWQSALMRVFEVSDTLVDDAILQRYLEEAELGMVHAAGRLNESIRNSASRLANELNCLRESANSTDTEALDAEIVSARDALRAVAVQSEAVGKFVLARHVWSMQKRLAENDEFLDSIPGYVRWSLAQFWAIGASALATSVCSAVYFGVPLVYATSGGLGLLALAFLWLGRRWRVLEARVHRHLDSQCASLRSELAAAHRQVLIAAIDQPLLRHTSKLAAAFGRGHQDAGGNKSIVVPGSTIEAWRLRLESAVAKERLGCC